MFFRIDCRNTSSDFKAVELWDSRHLCAHLLYEQETLDTLTTSQRGSFVLKRGDVAQFQCILLPLDFSSHRSTFRGTISVAFFDLELEKRFGSSEQITTLELNLPDECRAAIGKVYEWLLAVHKSEQNMRTLTWASPKIPPTSVLGELPESDDRVYRNGKLLNVDEDFLNPTVMSVACNELPGIDLTERVHVLKSNFDFTEFADTKNGTWFGIYFDLDVNVTSLPEHIRDLQVLVNFSFHRDTHEFVPSSHEQIVLVPTLLAPPETPSARAKRSLWFRVVIFILLAFAVAVVALRLYACRFGACDHNRRSQAEPHEIELHQTT